MLHKCTSWLCYSSLWDKYYFNLLGYLVDSVSIIPFVWATCARYSKSCFSRIISVLLHKMRLQLKLEKCHPLFHQKVQTTQVPIDNNYVISGQCFSLLKNHRVRDTLWHFPCISANVMLKLRPGNKSDTLWHLSKMVCIPFRAFGEVENQLSLCKFILRQITEKQ